jgi:hypothetical protein
MAILELNFNVWVDQDTAAMFANDDFLVLTDVELALGRNLIETASTSISLDGYHRQAVAGVFANT